jgi:hypothetical protein
MRADLLHLTGRRVRSADRRRALGAVSALDAVVDFDKIMRNPYDQRETTPFFDSGDYVNPNDKGIQAMADAVDPSALQCNR